MEVTKRKKHMTDVIPTNDNATDDALEASRDDGTTPAQHLAVPGSADDPAMPADDVSGDNGQYDAPKSDTGVDSDEAYQEGEDQAGGDPQHVGGTDKL